MTRRLPEDLPTRGRDTTALRCAECGERIVRGRSPGTFTHTTRLIAACDLDADHAAVPDLARDVDHPAAPAPPPI